MIRRENLIKIRRVGGNTSNQEGWDLWVSLPTLMAKVKIQENSQIKLFSKCWPITQGLKKDFKFQLVLWESSSDISLDCEQSLFFFRFSESNARAREPLPSRAISQARGHLRVSRFAWRTTEKKETARSLMFRSPRVTSYLSQFTIFLEDGLPVPLGKYIKAWKVTCPARKSTYTPSYGAFLEPCNVKERFHLYVHPTKFCADFKVLTTLLGSISHSGRGGVKGRLFCCTSGLSIVHVYIKKSLYRVLNSWKSLEICPATFQTLKKSGKWRLSLENGAKSWFFFLFYFYLFFKLQATTSAL